VTAGLTTTRAHAILNIYRASAYSAITPFVALHTGDPGSAGTANASGNTTRNALTLAAPSAGAAALSSIGTWTMNTSETITHISIWSASTAGTFEESWALSSGVPVVNGSTFSLTTLTLSYSPIAA